jgi:hypothetical protein
VVDIIKTLFLTFEEHIILGFFSFHIVGMSSWVPLTKHPSLPSQVLEKKGAGRGVGNQLSRVELLIIKHIPITKHFSIFFPSSVNQIEHTFCPWTHKGEGYKCSLNIRNKRAMQKTHEEMSDSLMQFF